MTTSEIRKFINLLESVSFNEQTASPTLEQLNQQYRNPFLHSASVIWGGGASAPTLNEFDIGGGGDGGGQSFSGERGHLVWIKLQYTTSSTISRVPLQWINVTLCPDRNECDIKFEFPNQNDIYRTVPESGNGADMELFANIWDDSNSKQVKRANTLIKDVITYNDHDANFALPRGSFLADGIDNGYIEFTVPPLRYFKMLMDSGLDLQENGTAVINDPEKGDTPITLPTNTEHMIYHPLLSFVRNYPPARFYDSRAK